MFNLQIIVGRLAEDPELHGEVSREDYEFEDEYEADKGSEYASFRVATWHFKTDATGADKKYTSHHHVDVYDAELAKTCVEKLKKGSSVLVAGRNWTNNWLERGVRRSRSFIRAEVVRSLNPAEINDPDIIKVYLREFIERI
jgi:single-stranded DNA-binding protein